MPTAAQPSILVPILLALGFLVAVVLALGLGLVLGMRSKPANAGIEVTALTVRRRTSETESPMRELALAMDDVSIADVKLKLPDTLVDEDNQPIVDPTTSQPLDPATLQVEWVSDGPEIASVEAISEDTRSVSIRSAKVGQTIIDALLVLPDDSKIPVLRIRTAIGNSAVRVGDVDALITVRREDAAPAGGSAAPAPESGNGGSPPSQ